MNYPIKHGVVTDWKDMETIWDLMLCDELQISPERYPVLLSENPFNPLPPLSIRK